MTIIKNVLDDIKTLVLDTSQNTPSAKRGNSFVLANLVHARMLPQSTFVVLKRGDFYSHAALIMDDWLINVASLTWAYNLKTNEVLNTLGELRVIHNELSPIAPTHFRWCLGNDHIIDDVTLDNASFSKSLFGHACENPAQGAYRPRYLCYKENLMHVLDGLDYFIYHGDAVTSLPLNGDNASDVLSLFGLTALEIENNLRRLQYFHTLYGL